VNISPLPQQAELPARIRAVQAAAADQVKFFSEFLSN
jgi:hypothetical protein